MSATTKRTFSLPNEQSHYIDTLVASGTYASGSEVVRAGLRALQERDAAVGTWLRDEVVKTYDAMASDPGAAGDPSTTCVPGSRRAMPPACGMPSGEPDDRRLTGGRRRSSENLRHISERSGAKRALGYVDRILAHCEGLSGVTTNCPLPS